MPISKHRKRSHIDVLCLYLHNRVFIHLAKFNNLNKFNNFFSDTVISLSDKENLFTSILNKLIYKYLK